MNAGAEKAVLSARDCDILWADKYLDYIADARAAPLASAGRFAESAK